MSGSPTLIDSLRADARKIRIPQAIRTQDTPRIFDWLLEMFSYQGISDEVARGYLAKHGAPTWLLLESSLLSPPSCTKLRSYWRFERCRFDKGSRTCSEPEHIDCCPLPRLPLRNGRLNQTAYSFYLFVRDIAGGDLIGWIDSRLAEAAAPSQAVEALVGPLRHVYGLSDKILTMALSSLLLVAPFEKSHWLVAGQNMIAIDTLIHNFLHRTGVLSDWGNQHAYGPACYAPGGCAEIIRSVSARIDARRFNRSFPANFPRFVQHAIWRYCAADGLNICNGNQIDDRKSCEMQFCQLFRICAKTPLKMQ